MNLQHEREAPEICTSNRKHPGPFTDLSALWMMMVKRVVFSCPSFVGRPFPVQTQRLPEVRHFQFVRNIGYRKA